VLGAPPGGLLGLELLAELLLLRLAIEVLAHTTLDVSAEEKPLATAVTGPTGRVQSGGLGQA
jgi:hypothetical protein